MPITFCSRSSALESVSRRETAVQGQTTATSCRYVAVKKNKRQKFIGFLNPEYFFMVGLYRAETINNIINN